MTLSPGMLIEHSTWGRGKVLHCDTQQVVVHFPQLAGSPEGPRRRLQAATPHLTESATQSDPLLDGIPVGLKVSKGKVKGTAVKLPVLARGLEETVQWFGAQYPGLFTDSKLKIEELTYKREAHALFVQRFGKGRGAKLLAAGRSQEISTALGQLVHATNIPSRYEIMAMNDGLKDVAASARLLEAVLGFLDDPHAASFDRLAGAVSGLPAPKDGSRVLTWPNVTILPFLADPTRFMVLKPEISELMASRMGRDLLYSSTPRWHTYSALQEMAGELLARLAPLGARDFIDVQSFMWVTRSAS